MYNLYYFRRPRITRHHNGYIIIIYRLPVREYAAKYKMPT